MKRRNRFDAEIVDFTTFVADLVYWHHDTFRAIWHDPVAETSFITFSLNPLGRIADVKFRMSEFIDPSEYTYQRSDP